MAGSKAIIAVTAALTLATGAVPNAAAESLHAVEHEIYSWHSYPGDMRGYRGAAIRFWCQR